MQKLLHPVEQPLSHVAHRKTGLANAMVLLTCLVMALGIFVIVLRVGSGGWMYNTHYIVLGMLLYVWTPMMYQAKSIAVLTWIGYYAVNSALSPLGSGLDAILLLTPAILYILFETRYMPALALVSAAAAAFYVWLGIYWHGAGAQPLWTPAHIQYAFNAGAIAFALFVICHTTFAALERSERDLARELGKSDRLLLTMLPDRIAKRLKEDPGATVTEHVADASVLFADLAGFTKFAAQHPPEDTVKLLDQLFSLFDEMAARHGMDKVKTIGDAYMVAGGLDGAPDHAERMAALALDMMAQAQPILVAADLGLRIGLHRGPLTAGVIGQQKPFFDVWGDTVNVAARLEAQGAPGRVQMSRAFQESLPGRFESAAPRRVEIAGKGDVTAFWLKRSHRLSEA